MLELKLDRVTKQYKEKMAVDHISVSFANGVYGLLGENGAGKTTLLRMICSLLPSGEGEIVCNGIPIQKMGREYRRLLGYLPQEFGYYPEFTPWRYLMYLASLKALPKALAQERCRELLKLVGLEGEERQKIKTFSGGMVRRLGIAQALLNDPEILILDEPTSGLDPRERIRVRNIISSLGKNRIVILSTHIVADVAYIADEILLMKKGKIIGRGSPEELVKRMYGCVWECMIPGDKVEEYTERYPVSNLKNVDNQVRLRMLSVDKPCENAVPAEPGLEDVYLYVTEEGRGAHEDFADRNI